MWRHVEMNGLTACWVVERESSESCVTAASLKIYVAAWQRFVFTRKSSIFHNLFKNWTQKTSCFCRGLGLDPLSWSEFCVPELFIDEPCQRNCWNSSAADLKCFLVHQPVAAWQHGSIPGSKRAKMRSHCQLLPVFPCLTQLGCEHSSGVREMYLGLKRGEGRTSRRSVTSEKWCPSYRSVEILDRSV